MTIERMESQRVFMQHISVRGARTHNLQNISVDIPKYTLTVITGVSGSGKSSLAFDTIFAEGQRKYVESISTYARQFLELMQKPDVESIEGLSPAIAIEQKTSMKNPRSTVGTATEIYDYMRLLWARVGVPHSPATGLPIESQTVSEMVEAVLAMPTGCRVLLLAPILHCRKSEQAKKLAELRSRGFQRVKIDGVLYELDQLPPLKRKHGHEIEVVVDRIAVQPTIAARLADSIETCLALGDGLMFVESADSGERLTFSTRLACPVSGFSLDEISPRLFSFNNPYGSCPACDGLGTQVFFDPELVVPDPERSLQQGAIRPWASRPSSYYGQTLDALAAQFSIDMRNPFRSLAPSVQQLILYGSGDTPVRFAYDDGTRQYDVVKPFEGVIPNMERRWRETHSPRVHEELSLYQSIMPCKACQGSRLKMEALSVRLSGRNIAEVSDLSVDDAIRWFAAADADLSPQKKDIARLVLREIRERLHFLHNVGLGYLTLSRASSTLSGGESQRIRLASQIGSGLTGVLYVLDEPSIGLHPRDNSRLIAALKSLRDLGNTVIVVEHDEETIRNADYLIDIGPGAGQYGGHIVAQGPVAAVVGQNQGLTAAYLNGTTSIPIPPVRRLPKENYAITISGARANNLQNVSAAFPLGLFICVTGVSGGGKSSLVLTTLYRALARRLLSSREPPGDHDDITGIEFIDKVIDVDQSPIGRTPRSNPATYTGVLTPVRDWFAGLPEARARGYRPGRFSFNVKGGRCEACEGDGVIKIEMHFLPDVYVQCDNCKGRRYNRETLEIRFRNKSIADILDMTVEEALAFFAAVPVIRDKLAALIKVGLGYIHLGQQATTLSGGEAQRVKLARELSRRATGKTLYILDEPTTGLHFDDVRKLLEVLHLLVDQGNTVIVIEHNLDVIKTADWLIDLGPEGGSGGGRIVAAGPPEAIVACAESHTGQCLAPHLRPAAA
jgi:excinuclease ABC subunit A